MISQEQILSKLNNELSESSDKLELIGAGSHGRFFRAKGDKLDLFIKMGDNQDDVISSEVDGLKKLEKNSDLIPKMHFSDDEMIVMDFIEARPSQATYWDRLGAELAKLHKQPQKKWGLESDNWIGAAKQINLPAVESSWFDFFWLRRLDQKRQAIEKKWQTTVGYWTSVESAYSEQFRDYKPTISLLHGDLWSGNTICGADQTPYLVDPACYFGDRETDLAMTECFGGFSQTFYDSYNANYELDEGYEERKHWYNLFHLLNHWLIFGNTYKTPSLRIMEQLKT